MKELYRFRQYLTEGVIKEEKYSGAIIRKGSSDKAKEDTKIVKQALKKAGIKFTNRGEFGMNFKDADLAQIKKVIAGEKVGEFVVSRDVNEGVIKEEVDVLGNEFTQEIQDDMKMYYKMDVDMDDIKDWVNMYYIGYNSEYDEGPGDVDYEGNEFGSEDYESEKKELVFDTAEREDFYDHLNPEADSTFPNLAEGKLLKEDMSFDSDIEGKTNKNDFAFWYREGAMGKKQALQAQELLKQKGINADYSKGPFYIDFSNSNVEQRVAMQLLRDAGLTRFVITND